MSLEPSEEQAEVMAGGEDGLGWLRYRLWEIDRAQPLLKDAVSSQPNLPIFRYHLGMAYLASDKVDLAREELQHTLDLSKERPFTQQAKVEKVLGSLPQGEKTK